MSPYACDFWPGEEVFVDVLLLDEVVCDGVGEEEEVVAGGGFALLGFVRRVVSEGRRCEEWEALRGAY
jgi:hypothetical protein